MGDPFATNADAGLVELFRAESDTHIPALSQGLLGLEKGQADDQSIATMMRAAHSIKGAARIVGIDAAVRLAHVMEDCFTASKEKRSILSSEAVDVLLRGLDALQRVCSLEPEADMTEAWLDGIVSQLTAVKEGRTAPAPTREPVAPPPPTADAIPAKSGDGDARRTLILPAELDGGAAEDLRRAWNEAFDAGTSEIRLDFSGVRQVSAGGLALLASLARDASRREPAPTIGADGIPGPLAALLRVTAIDRVLAAST